MRSLLPLLHTLLSLFCASLLFGQHLPLTSAPLGSSDSLHTHKIRIDQFGYLPDASKVAVIADPQVGWDSAQSFTPGATLEVRRVSDGSVVFSAAPAAMSAGVGLAVAHAGDQWRCAG